MLSLSLVEKLLPDQALPDIAASSHLRERSEELIGILCHQFHSHADLVQRVLRLFGNVTTGLALPVEVELDKNKPELCVCVDLAQRIISSRARELGLAQPDDWSNLFTRLNQAILRLAPFDFPELIQKPKPTDSPFLHYYLSIAHTPLNTYCGAYFHMFLVDLAKTRRGRTGIRAS
jgi:hypothetical protein